MGHSLSYDSSHTLFKPPKGAFMPFSEGPRGCPDRRFAQIEVTAVTTAIFQGYSVELDVRGWATDEEVERMTKEQRRDLYAGAVRKVQTTIRRAEIVATLKLTVATAFPCVSCSGDPERFGDVDRA